MNERERDAMLAAMQEEKEGGKKNIWTLPSDFEGTKTIRILPPLVKKGEVKFYFSHKVHWIQGRPFEDLSQTFYDSEGKLIHEGVKDPVQAFVQKLYRNSQRGSEEFTLASELNAKKRYFSRIVVRNPDAPETELFPEFFEYGPTIWNILYHIMKETDFGIIVHPKTGRDFNLTKKGKGRQSKYETSTPSVHETPIFSTAEKLAAVFENAMAMDYLSLITIPSYEEKEEALHEYVGKPTKTQVVNPGVPESQNASRPSKQSPVKKNDVFEDDDVDDDNGADSADSDDADIDSILSEFTNF